MPNMLSRVRDYIKGQKVRMQVINKDESKIPPMVKNMLEFLGITPTQDSADEEHSSKAD